MRQQVQNGFNKGLNTDTYKLQTPNDVYTDAENMAFVSHEGDELILQNEKGTLRIAQFPSDLHPLAARGHNGVAYIVSAVKDGDGNFTGEGEVGTFPSPDHNSGQTTPEGWKTGALLDVYGPLRNYLGDGRDPGFAEEGDYDRPFRSRHFRFSKNTVLQLTAIQQVYDDTVNIFFTDWESPARVVNSRFTVLPDKRFRIVDRTGDDDSNLYDERDFESRINHIYTTGKLASVEYTGRSDGGGLACGTYKYFFRYATADGNVSDIIGESFNIPVYVGEDRAGTRGGFGGERTQWANNLRIHDLDQSYTFVRLYFTFTGHDGTVLAYEVDRNYRITGDSIDIVHNGLEQVLDHSTDEILETFATFDTYRTATEVQGKMVIGNIKGKVRDYTPLKEFARRIKVGHTIVQMPVPGSERDAEHGEIYRRYEHDRQRGGTWDGGYANPRNVHDFLGYWDGEAYCFGVVFVFRDGSTTPAFPVRGLDATKGNTYAGTDFSDPALENFDTATGENVKGIYRFPKITNRLSGGLVQVAGARFTVPADVPQVLLEQTSGFFFVRSQRLPDAIAQGILIDTLPMPLMDLEGGTAVGTDDGTNPRYEFYDYSNDNYKLVPAWKHITESLTRKLARDGARPGTREPYGPYQGIDPVRFNVYGLGPNKVDDSTGRKKQLGDGTTRLDRYWRKQFALYVPEVQTRKAQLATDTASASSIMVDAQFATQYAVRSRRAFQTKVDGDPYGTELPDGTEGNEGNTVAMNDVNDQYFSLIKTIYTKRPEGWNASEGRADRTGQVLGAGFDYVNARQSLPASDRGFASRCNFHARFQSSISQRLIGDTDGDYGDTETKMWGGFQLDFNEYIGVTLDRELDAMPPPPDYGALLAPMKAYVRNGAQFPYASGITDGNEVRSTAGIWLDHFGNNFMNGWVDGAETAAEEELGLVSGTNGLGAGPGGLLVSMYRGGNGMRTTLALRDLYQPEFQDWFRISQPVYWDGRAKAVAGGRNVPVVDDFPGRGITAWNGDNYIGMHYHRVFFNRLDRLTVDNRLPQRSVNAGYSIAWTSNSNHNNHFRNEEVLDINEGRARSFVPYYADRLDMGNGQGDGNPWRSYRLPESYSYSIGYSYQGSSRRFAAFDPDAPFIQDVFDTRVYISDIHVKGSFRNGYRYFDFLAYKDYPRHIGQLTKLVNLNGRLYAIHENGVLLIPVGERVGGTGDAAGDVFFKAAEKLPPVEAVGYISELYGSRWINSIARSDNAVYFVDTDKGKWCRIQNGQGIELFGDFRVQKLLRDRKDWFGGRTEGTERFIRTFYDPFKNHIMFNLQAPPEGQWAVVRSFRPTITWTGTDHFTVGAPLVGNFREGTSYRFASGLVNGAIFQITDISNNRDGTYDLAYAQANDFDLPDGGERQVLTVEELAPAPPRHLSLTYNEMPLGQWVTRNTWRPILLFSIFDRVYSIPDGIERPWIEQHYKGPYQTYYGRLLESSVEVVVTYSPAVHQIFDNLAILGSHTYPVRAEFTTDNGTEVQTIYPRNVVSGESAPFQQAPANLMRQYDSVYKEGIMYVTVNPDNRDNRAPEFNNRRVRDKYCRIRLVYLTPDELFIQNLMTFITMSYS